MAKKKINGTVVSLASERRRRLWHYDDDEEIIDENPNNSSYGVNPQNITFTYEEVIVTLADFMNDTYGNMVDYPNSVMTNSTFEYLTGEDASIFYLEQGSMTLQNMTFRNNEAKASGSSNIVTVGSFLNISECYFENNEADYGGVLYAKEESYINIEGSEFYQNYANE